MNFLNTGNKTLIKNLASFTLFFVFRATVNNATQRCLFADYTNSTGFTRGGYFLNPASIAVARNNETGSSVSVSGGTPSTDANIATVVINNTSNPLHSFLNGTSLGTSNFGTTGNTPNTDSAQNTNIGCFLSGAGNLQHFNGDAAVVAAFQVALSGSQRKRLEHAAAYSFKISCN